MKSTIYLSETGRSETKLFRFTAREERMMSLAKKLALEFMRNYGKGREPYMLNRDNYLCSYESEE